MMAISLRTRIVLLLLVTADLMVFSRITLLPLIAMTIGAATIILGIVSMYRIASVLGLLVVIATAAASIEIPSLLELGAILTAIIALLLPIMTITWLSLSVEEGESQQVSFRTRPGVVALVFALLCVWSAPLAILVLSFFAPSVSMRLDTMAEISILLVATIAGSLLILRRRPIETATSAPEGGA